MKTPSYSVYSDHSENSDPKFDPLHLKQALRLARQSGPGWLAADVLLIVIQGLLPLASLYLIKLTADAAAAHFQTPENFRLIVILILMLAGVRILEAALSSAVSIIGDIQAHKVGAHVSDMLHAKSVELDLAYYEDPAYRDIYFRAQQEAPHRPLMIVRGVLQTCGSGVMLIAVSGLLLSFHWLIGTVLLVAVVPGIVIRIRYADQLYRQQQHSSEAERQAHYYQWILTGDMFAKEVRIFQFGALFMERFRRLRDQVHKEKRKVMIGRALAEMSYQICAAAAVCAGLIFIVSRMVAGSASIGDVLMCYQALIRCQSAMRDFLSGVSGLYEHSIFLNDFFAFAGLCPKITRPDDPKPMPVVLTKGIVFDRVCFQYSSSRRKVFDNLTLHIRPGEHVAFVGENGEGKTTLIKLLCRLYDPADGRITIDGTDIRQFDPAALRRGISVIFQDYVKYHLTVRENICLGDGGQNTADGVDERVADSVRLSGAQKLIDGLPHGYDTILGKWFTGGEELSIGEWQKIALARAFMRDAQIIILDEPTSALDPGAEYEALTRFKKMADGKTAIFISHRLSMARLADRICVFKNGKIAETGTHDALMRQNGIYAGLFRLQAQNYHLHGRRPYDGPTHTHPLSECCCRKRGHKTAVNG